MTNDILASRDERWDRIADQAEGRAELDRALFDEAREGERVVSIMEAIVTDRPLLELAVNVRNDGLIPNLPAEAVVEVPGMVDGRGVHGIAVGALPEGIAGILAARARQQELTVDAALTGDRALALQALPCEMLLRDGGLAALPAVAQLAQVRQDHLARNGVEAERPDRAVEGGLRPGVVEADRAPRAARRRSRGEGGLRAPWARPSRAPGAAASLAGTPASTWRTIARTRASSSAE